ncbi:PadR family transcriptional regulator [Microbacterium oryzae]|uniref:PadR family transcriptional regulator n=1 Tax=Microbacterium oryzae TaxID=743009 RepID=UPI0025B1FC0A|nr:PadR family transcriptional regulator [Microbacterium oryzae]MDN3311601.1 PadR family transcriptional regulator [Microbacterium oryzae]
MKLESPLLGLLAARRMTGYDIRKWTTVEGKFLGLDRHPSQIYRELNRMEADGLVEHEVDARDGAPDAKLYQLTPAGFERLLSWVRSAYVPPARFQNPEFVMRLRITAMIDPPRARLLVEEEHAARVLQVAENRGRSRAFDHLEAEQANPQVDTRALALVTDAMNEYGQQSIDSWIAWLKKMMLDLDELLAASVDTTKDGGAA